MYCIICLACSPVCIPIFDKSGNDKNNILVFFAELDIQLYAKGSPMTLCPQCYVTIMGFQQIVQNIARNTVKAQTNSKLKVFANVNNCNRERLPANPASDIVKSTPMDLEVQSECKVPLLSLNDNTTTTKVDTIFHNCDIEIEESSANVRSTICRVVNEPHASDKSKRQSIAKYSKSKSVKSERFSDAEDLQFPVKLERSGTAMGHTKVKLEKKYVRCELCGVMFIEDIAYNNHLRLKHTNCAPHLSPIIKAKPFKCMKSKFCH